MPFSFFRRILRRSPREFPPAWRAILRRTFWHYPWLSALERERLERDTAALVAGKHWEGCGGLVLSDEIRVTIAADAALLVLGFPDYLYQGLDTLLVYPGGFLVEREPGEDAEHLLGEAHEDGPVVISWWGPEAGPLRFAWTSAVVFHELAHHLDMLDGEIDGLPWSGDRALRARWRALLDDELERYARNERRGRDTLLSCFDLDDDAEFFAYASECFFLYPARLRREYPGIYRVLSEFYRQDPADRGQDRPEEPWEVLEPGEDG